MAKRDERAVTPQSESFSDWYQDVVLRAELADRGPVKGTMIIRPYGYRIWELLQSELDARIKATGHENASFPLFIPEGHLRREAEHVEGFAPELAVVTIAGGKELDEPIVVRPTSETLVGEAYSRWISSYRDLPLLINQWANVVRWELRPRLFLRTTEFLWQEGHTAHADEQDAMAETMLALSFYEETARDVAAIPVLAGEKTAGERFAGAARTYTIEGMMRDGRALQAGTSHYLGTNFARAFDIKYTSAAGVEEYCHTTSWGMSARMIGGVVMTHGDDKGLILPPRLAPYQVVIVPIGREDDLPEVVAAAERLADLVRQAGLRVRIDTRTNLSAGFKFNDWEMKGAPLRLELGPRDLAAGVVTLASRLGGEKERIPLDEVASVLPPMLEAFQTSLLDRARSFRDERIAPAGSREEVVEAVAKGFASMLHCGRPECEDDIKLATTATPRCIPLEGEIESGDCAWCCKPSGYDRRLLFGRSY